MPNCLMSIAGWKDTMNGTARHEYKAEIQHKVFQTIKERRYENEYGR